MGAILTRLFRMSGNNEFSMMLYSELHKKPEPKLTAAQIKEKVIAKLQ